MKNLLLLLVILFVACKPQSKTIIAPWNPYNESEEIAKNLTHESQKMRFKLIQSKILNKNEILESIKKQLNNFSETDYQKLITYILEQDILTLQKHIISGILTYETLTQWYLYRIAKYENDSTKCLNNIISINPNAVAEAIKKDRIKSENNHPIFGIPILIKDNINLKGMATTAGANALKNNITSDAFIIEKIKEKGGIILGKTNLSEWANYLCIDCPNGYSAIGGQTLNPYGRKKFDTGGSSSGSGSSMAANYAAAAIGTETSGSILSPSSANSIVGLKPTTGLLSRTGIVPISSTFDTPGPMTRNVTDNAILISAMIGEDDFDLKTKHNYKNKKYWEDLKIENFNEIRFGVFKTFLKDSIYKQSIEKIISLGGIVIEIEPEKVNFEGFGTVLNADMKVDLTNYLNNYASKKVQLYSVQDIIDFNKKDSLLNVPYSQGRFDGILKEKISAEDLIKLKMRLKNESVNFFEKPMNAYQLDAILSINNRNAGFAAAANYPCLTIPMGYSKLGEPIGLTFISRPFEEDKLLKIGYVFEQATKIRKLPINY